MTKCSCNSTLPYLNIFYFSILARTKASFRCSGWLGPRWHHTQSWFCIFALNLYCISWPRWLHTSWSQSRVHSVHHKTPPTQLGSVKEELGSHTDKKAGYRPAVKNLHHIYCSETLFWRGGSFLWKKRPEVFTVWVMSSLILVYCRVWGIFWRRFMVTFCDVFHRGRKGRRGQ